MPYTAKVSGSSDCGKFPSNWVVSIPAAPTLGAQKNSGLRVHTRLSKIGTDFESGFPDLLAWCWLVAGHRSPPTGGRVVDPIYYIYIYSPPSSMFCMLSEHKPSSKKPPQWYYTPPPPLVQAIPIPCGTSLENHIVYITLGNPLLWATMHIHNPNLGGPTHQLERVAAFATPSSTCPTAVFVGLFPSVSVDEARGLVSSVAVSIAWHKEQVWSLSIPYTPESSQNDEGQAGESFPVKAFLDEAMAQHIYK
ncbi:hypothetical protein BD779DRAFT_1476990 [Infundibulicybe gibba]|nr:hypothetical protein BD779DRAFT_1476990 [Infundibulicybe gibba]